jgi:hypothetical protein
MNKIRSNVQALAGDHIHTYVSSYYENRLNWESLREGAARRGPHIYNSWKQLTNVCVARQPSVGNLLRYNRVHNKICSFSTHQNWRLTHAPVMCTGAWKDVKEERGSKETQNILRCQMYHRGTSVSCELELVF